MAFLHNFSTSITVPLNENHIGITLEVGQTSKRINLFHGSTIPVNNKSIYRATNWTSINGVNLSFHYYCFGTLYTNYRRLQLKPSYALPRMGNDLVQADPRRSLYHETERVLGIVARNGFVCSKTETCPSSRLNICKSNVQKLRIFSWRKFAAESFQFMTRVDHKTLAQQPH